MTTPTTVISGSAPGVSATAPMSFSGGAGSSSSSCQGGRAASAPAPAAAPPQARVQPVLRLRYSGVRQLPGGGGWAARVLVDPERQLYREVGPFPDEHAAALAHDRVAIAYLGDRARANFLPAFHPMEQRFLRVCREHEEAGGIDVCALVSSGAYEARYAAFLRTVLGLQQWGEYQTLVVDFFICRYVEIGEEALVEGGEKLAAKFVEMHRNKATNPGWREWYINKVLYMQKRKAEEELRRDGQGGAAAAALQPQPQQQPEEEQQQQKRQRCEGGYGAGTRAGQPQQPQQQQ